MKLLLLCASVLLVLSVAAGQMVPREEFHTVTVRIPMHHTETRPHTEEVAHVVEVKEFSPQPPPMVKKLLDLMESVQPANHPAKQPNVAIENKIEKVTNEMVKVPEVSNGPQPKVPQLKDTHKVGVSVANEIVPENPKLQVPERDLFAPAKPTHTTAITGVPEMPKVVKVPKFEVTQEHTTIVGEVPNVQIATVTTPSSRVTKMEPPNKPSVTKCPYADLPKVPMPPPLAPMPKMMDPTEAEQTECERECSKFEFLPICAFNGDCFHEFPNQCVMDTYICENPDKGFKATLDDRCLMHWLTHCTEEDLIN